MKKNKNIKILKLIIYIKLVSFIKTQSYKNVKIIPLRVCGMSGTLFSSKSVAKVSADIHVVAGPDPFTV